MTLRRIERWFWYVFVATAAWQTRIIFWQADRTFIEWRSMSLYLSDVLMLVLFILATVTLFLNSKARNDLSLGVGGGTGPARGRLERFSLAVFFFFAAISLFNASQLTVGIYALVRLAQFIALFVYVRWWAFRRFNIDHTAVAFVIGALVQSGIGIAQGVLQHDVGFRWLGETLLRPNMSGVAVFYDTAHHLVLRAYGTLPHPNVLAVYLMVALWVIWWLWIRHGDSAHRSWAIWPTVTTVLLWAFYLTFSRTIIAVWAAGSLVIAVSIFAHRMSDHWNNIAIIRKRTLHVLVTLGVVSLVFAALWWPQIDARLHIASTDEAVQLRLDYTRDSLGSGGGFLHVNWFGVGIGNFTTWLSRSQPRLPAYAVQPAHNLFLLIYSEIGLCGALLFVVWCCFILLSCWHAYVSQPLLRIGMLTLVVALLCVALFDHFFWTLQQGRIVFWMVMALAAGSSLATIQPHERSH